MSDVQLLIAVQTKYYAGSDASQPGIVVQVTRLRGSRREQAAAEGHLARDWACAMPPGKGGQSTGTTLFRTTGSDAALSMACRLAKRLQAQVFVALDVESRLVMVVEKRIVDSLAV
ncbi:hypothetical protein B0H17DRAFT_1041148 [Mycena rosella]|uniref:Uncharacterized protein n=1 Tax=Mycena rosella TaxID=1033263 RepID=A0AAD7GRD0_MYCRO|nr:hypothetical protein B0H17DRAFT_1041148 [Mycena rosella]